MEGGELHQGVVQMLILSSTRRHVLVKVPPPIDMFWAHASYQCLLRRTVEIAAGAQQLVSPDLHPELGRVRTTCDGRFFMDV